MDLYAAPPTSDAVVLAERRLDAAREALARVRVLLVEVDWHCRVLPEQRCITWLGETAQAYELKLGELVGRAGLARASLEQGERELASSVGRLEYELDLARASGGAVGGGGESVGSGSTARATRGGAW
ncbi:hypothetical protein ACWKWP_09250 [Agromyces soli]